MPPCSRSSIATCAACRPTSPTRGYARDLLIMNGNGGTVAARLAIDDAAKTVMSGPASGVMAAAATLAASGLANAITYDMGGTSTDVALIHGGIPEVSAELTIDYGLPIHVPMVDVRTVGAGGGSIAWIDAAGMLKVGPESAGSTPGPICFGRGGTRPTITDANVILGRLPHERLTAVDRPVSLEHIRAHLRRDAGRAARPLDRGRGRSRVRLANLTMAGTIRLVSLSRGHDPRDFVLFAFGGAGPLHAVALARDLGIPEVLVPARPGLTNALGCLVADLRQDFVRDDQRAGRDGRHGRRSRACSPITMRARPRHQCGRRRRDRRDGGACMQPTCSSAARRTSSACALPSARLIARRAASAVRGAPISQRFQVELPEIKAQLVNLATTRDRPSAAVSDRGAAAAAASGANSTTRSPARAAFTRPASGTTRVYARERLPRGAEIAGPAIVEQIDATTIIEPAAHARVDVSATCAFACNGLAVVGRAATQALRLPQALNGRSVSQSAA